MMLGCLPTTVNVNGRNFDIRTDFRDILQVILAFHDDALSNTEKAYVLLNKLYVHVDQMPEDDYPAACQAAISFIECQTREDKPGPQLINWEKDEQMLFPAINKVAGYEVRACKYLHWWTFLGYFQGVDHDSTWGYVLMIRQKKAKHKKLEKHEQEFFNANRVMCEVTPPKTREQAYNDLDALFDDLHG